MIRTAVQKDVEAIARVHVTSWRETYPGIMPAEILAGLREEQRAEQWRRWFLPDRPPREALIVCEDDGEVVGFASAVIPPNSSEAELLTLYLVREAQGRGFGRNLMIEIARRLQHQGATSLMLWMAAGNPTAGFYSHMGGVVVRAEARPFGPHTIDETQYRWPNIATVTATP